MRIGIVVRGGYEYSAARVRALQFLPLFEASGDDVRWMAWRPSSRRGVFRESVRLFRMARWADVVLLQRPNQPIFVLRTLARVQPRLVVDFDDALWVSADGSRSGDYGTRLETAVSLARVVTPGSEHLASWVRDLLPSANIRVIRPSTRLRPLDRGPVIAGSDCILGWIGSAANFRDLDPIIDALREVTSTRLQSGGRCRLRVVSSEPLILPGLEAEFVVWSEIAEQTALDEFDIGLMPLNTDERSRGRCGFKTIQYLSASVPAVSSPVGVGPEIISEGKTGRLASSSSDWSRILLELANDPEQRSRLGANGRTWVADNASIDSAFAQLREALLCATE